MKQDASQITDSILNDLFPAGSEHNRERAMELVNSGTIHEGNIEHIHLASRFENLCDVLVFKFYVTPSVKTYVKTKLVMKAKNHQNAMRHM